MAGKKYYITMYYITYQYFFLTITYGYRMYFFRTFKKSTAPYKVHNMGLRYIKLEYAFGLLEVFLKLQ